MAAPFAGVCPNAYRCRSVRTNNIPSLIAGVDMHVSPIALAASSSNFGPVLISRTNPSSLVQYNRPSAATGDAVYSPVDGRWLVTPRVETDFRRTNSLAASRGRDR